MMTSNRKQLVLREVVLQRPYEMETLTDILTHLASLTSRGVIVWEARCTGGRMRYLIGMEQKSVSRVQEVFQAHAQAQFIPAGARQPIIEAKKLRTSKPILSMNTDVAAAMIRASLAAMTGGKSDCETVVQTVLGACSPAWRAMGSW